MLWLGLIALLIGLMWLSVGTLVPFHGEQTDEDFRGLDGMLHFFAFWISFSMFVTLGLVINAVKTSEPINLWWFTAPCVHIAVTLLIHLCMFQKKLGLQLSFFNLITWFGRVTRDERK